MSQNIARRSFLQATGASALATGLVGEALSEQLVRTLRVAAVQMHASIGAVRSNLDKARVWVEEAFKQGAELVVLPEFFASGMARSDLLLDAHRPIDGEPMQLLKELAKQGQAYVCGSYLAEANGDVFNTFVLATPNGDTFQHDKDFPSFGLESSYYAGGEDGEYVSMLRQRVEVPNKPIVPVRKENRIDGVFSDNRLKMGCALCWEQLRYRTFQRLFKARPQLVLAASGWATVDPRFGENGFAEESQAQEMYRDSHEIVRKAPIRMAKLLGCPVVHANLCGSSWSLNENRTSKFLMRFLGESSIVDANGNVLKRRSREQGEGIVIADIQPMRVKPTAPIPNTDWTEDVAEKYVSGWYTNSGREYYFGVTRPFRQRLNGLR